MRLASGAQAELPPAGSSAGQQQVNGARQAARRAVRPEGQADRRQPSEQKQRGTEQFTRPLRQVQSGAEAATRRAATSPHCACHPQPHRQQGRRYRPTGTCPRPGTPLPGQPMNCIAHMDSLTQASRTPVAAGRYRTTQARDGSVQPLWDRIGTWWTSKRCRRRARSGR